MDHKAPSDKFDFAKRDTLIISITGIALFLLMAWVFYKYMTPEWKSYQAEFKDLVGEKFGEARIATVPSGLQQVYVKQLNTADRCVTCHMATEWKGLENAPEPFRTHPKQILEKHPISQYGCTPCHGGQGYATDVQSAHGFSEHWEEPLLGKELGEFYAISSKSAM